MQKQLEELYMQFQIEKAHEWARWFGEQSPALRMLRRKQLRKCYANSTLLRGLLRDMRPCDVVEWLSRGRRTQFAELHTGNSGRSRGGALHRESGSCGSDQEQRELEGRIRIEEERFARFLKGLEGIEESLVCVR